MCLRAAPALVLPILITVGEDPGPAPARLLSDDADAVSGGRPPAPMRRLASSYCLAGVSLGALHSHQHQQHQQAAQHHLLWDEKGDKGTGCRQTAESLRTVARYMATVLKTI